MIITERISEVHNEDCMIGMARYPNKWFDLACIDPPYGIGMSGGHIGGSVLAKTTNYKHFHGNDLSAPDNSFFDELFRISKNQIIWGANHFLAKTSSCWIVWDKQNGDNNFADCELAWTSFDTAVRKFEFRWAGMLQGNMKNKEDRIHPTQKPVSLYDWIYKNYLPQGGKVIDTHLGSGSNRIAANKAGNIDFVGFELDKDYYEAQEKRWKGFIAQTRLF